MAVVTGASRGIGLAVAKRIVSEGGRVVITARKPDPLKEAVLELGGACAAIGIPGAADDTDHQSMAAHMAVDAFGRLDVLVVNSAVNPAYGDLIDTDLGAARKVMEVNVLGAVSWTREVVGVWMSRHGGAVVNIASVAGLRPSTGIGFYGASKAALMQVTAQLAVELGPGIRVNAVAPAVVKTRFASMLFEGKEEEVAAAYPLKRLGIPEDIAAAVAFLGSDDAGWMTGQTIVVDGGLTLGGGV